MFKKKVTHRRQEATSEQTAEHNVLSRLTGRAADGATGGSIIEDPFLREVHTSPSISNSFIAQNPPKRFGIRAKSGGTVTAAWPRDISMAGQKGKPLGLFFK